MRSRVVKDRYALTVVAMVWLEMGGSCWVGSVERLDQAGVRVTFGRDGVRTSADRAYLTCLFFYEVVIFTLIQSNAK